MKLTVVLAALMLIAWTGEVRAEPVSASIGLTALLTSAGLGAATAAAVGGAVVTAGISFAISAASAALSGQDRQTQLKGGQGVSVAEEGTRQPQINPIPEQRLVLGTVTSSGALCFRRSDPPFIWRTFLLASHECGQLEELILNGEAVRLNLAAAGIQTPFEAPFFDGTTTFLEIAYRNGDRDQAIDPILARDFPALPATFRHRGHATITIKADYGSSDAVHTDVYGSNNVFNPLARFQGAKLIDPRVPGVVIDDPDTWVHSNSASLAIMRALYHPWPDMRLLDPGSINWDLMAEAADIDDEMRGTRSGALERNHTCDGIILSTFDPVEKLKELLTSCDGFLIADGGKYHIMPGAPREPEMTLTQAMLAGGFEMHTETPDRDLINTIKTEGIAADRDYKPQTGPVIRRHDLVALDGRPQVATLSLPFTEGDADFARPQRLGMRKLKESRGADGTGSLRRAFSATFTFDAREAKAGKIVRLDFPDFPKVDGVYFVKRSARNEKLNTITLDLTEWSNAKYDYNAVTDQRPFDIDQSVIAAEAA